MNHLALAKAGERLLDVGASPGPGGPHITEGGGLLKAAKDAVRLLVDDDHATTPYRIEQQLMIWIEWDLDNLLAADPAVRAVRNRGWRHPRGPEVSVVADRTCAVLTTVEQ
jgi:hypothetical protein